MDNEQLKTYVANERARGVSVADLQTALLSSGWKAEDVSRTLGLTAQNVISNVALDAPKKFSFTHLDHGRVGRLQYFFSILMFIVIEMMIVVFAISIAISLKIEGVAVIIPVFIAVISYLFLLIFAVFLGVRRLHDMNMSGWFYLILLIPLVGSIFALVMLLKKGTVGVNRFGEASDPRRSTWKVFTNT